jgi:hypothetical protein
MTRVQPVKSVSDASYSNEPRGGCPRWRQAVTSRAFSGGHNEVFQAVILFHITTCPRLADLVRIGRG